MIVRLTVLAMFLASMISGLCLADPQPCEAPDSGSHRVVMGTDLHTCPPGQIVIGIHAGENRLLCTQAGCFAGTNLDFSKEFIEKAYSEQGMRACPSGTLLTGFHKGNNQVSCVPMIDTGSGAQPIPRVVDAATHREGMHACPATGPSYAVGINVAQNLLLCAGLLATESVDTSTQVPGAGAHGCPAGSFITGIHIVENRLLCSTSWGRGALNITKVTGSGSDSMTSCSPGMAMVGYNNSKNEVFCSQLAPAPRMKNPTTNDSNTQRQGMHACPPRSVVSGIDADDNVLQCTWHP